MFVVEDDKVSKRQSNDNRTQVLASRLQTITLWCRLLASWAITTQPYIMSHPEDGTEQQPAEKEELKSIPFSPMTRHLQSFGAPDLQVSIGEDEQLYHYHSLILASQSLYIDTLLSSPVAHKEQEKMRISFPEIQPETWEKMMKYLGPSEANPSLDDLLLIIPLYDKYQFLAPLQYCDIHISKDILTGNIGGYYDMKDDGSAVKAARLVSLVYNIDLFPLSKPLAVKWAENRLSKLICVNEEVIQLLVPLIENDEKIIRSLMSTFLGRKCKEMTMNDMRDVIMQPKFAEKCISRCHEIKEIGEQSRCLRPESLSIYGCGGYTSCIEGKYTFESAIRTYGKFAGGHVGGVAAGTWERERVGDIDGVSHRIFVASVDVWGTTWEIYACPIRDDGDNNNSARDECENKTVLYRWENGIYNSLIPPKQGWKVIDGRDADSKRFRVDYSIGQRGNPW